MRPTSLVPVVLLAASAFAGAVGFLQAEDERAVLNGDALNLNGKTINIQKEKDFAKLGKAIQAAGGDALRAKDAALKVVLGEKSEWGSLQFVLLAAAATKIRKAEVFGEAAESAVTLDLPGADAQNGQVVDLPLSRDASGKLVAETDGQRYVINAELLKGLVAQTQGAVVNLVAPADFPARDVLKTLRLLKDVSAKFAYLPHKAMAEAQAHGANEHSEEHESGASRMAKGLSE